MTTGVFCHGIASGDPLPDGVVIWTRVTCDDDDVPVEWFVARAFKVRDVVASGVVLASRSSDHTVHVEVKGLEPGTAYEYGFAALGTATPVGRTRTLGGPRTQHLRFAACSCANFQNGLFNAYARIADRNDLDFVLHLGDYVYDSGNRRPDSPGPPAVRLFDPPWECRTLDDYRRRYALYRTDPNLQRLHASLPLVATLDDHELADGAWAGGASAHNPAVHGDWIARRDAALRARWEWLPLRRPSDPLRTFREFQVGDLANVWLLDVRTHRDRPVAGQNLEHGRTMLGAAQREWLLAALDRRPPGWWIVATGAIMNRSWCDGAREPLRTALLELGLIDDGGEGPDVDQWDGYVAEREELLSRFPSAAGTIVLSGDIHVGVASEIPDAAGQRVATELTVPSITSHNLDDKLGLDARAAPVADAERGFVDALDHVRWCDFASHGYLVVDITRERVEANWWAVASVRERSDDEERSAAFRVERGRTGPAPLARMTKWRGSARGGSGSALGEAPP